MISMSPITGTGEKKCRPMKRLGRSVAVASAVMLMLLVLLFRPAGLFGTTRVERV